MCNMQPTKTAWWPTMTRLGPANQLHQQERKLERERKRERKLKRKRKLER